MKSTPVLSPRNADPESPHAVRESLTSAAFQGRSRVFATTVLRESGHALTGYLLELDWRIGAVRRSLPIPVDTRHPLWNGRGGNRGGRGLAVHDGVLYVATAMSVLMYDTELQFIGELASPYLCGLHELFAEPDGLWCTSTVHDLIVKIDYQGRMLDQWWGSESPALQRALRYEGRALNLDLKFPTGTFEAEYDRYCQEERLHVNTVWRHDGELYVLACRKNALIRIRPEPETIILEDPALGSPHNGILTPDGRVLINDTINQRLRIYDRQTGQCEKTIETIVRQEGRSSQFVRVGWQRGLAHAEGSIYLVGTSPAAVFEVDIDSGRIGRLCVIDQDVRHCIHGLIVTDQLTSVRHD